MSIKDDPLFYLGYVVALVAAVVLVALVSNTVEFSKYTCTKTDVINGAAKCIIYELRGEVK
jgi:inorganic pyrophosphatase/exopolyphosphatase